MAASGQSTDRIASLLTEHQLDLAESGRRFLVTEASRASFVLIGGLHGDNETQALLEPLTEGLGSGQKVRGLGIPHLCFRIVDLAFSGG
jgi:hypothetical protein